MVASRVLSGEPGVLGNWNHADARMASPVAGRIPYPAIGSISMAHAAEHGMTPDFTLMLLVGAIFGIAMLVFIGWRFGGPDVLAFAIVAGLFPACLDFLSSFAARNYEYPGQSRL